MLTPPTARRSTVWLVSRCGSPVRPHTHFKPLLTNRHLQTLEFETSREFSGTEKDKNSYVQVECTQLFVCVFVFFGWIGNKDESFLLYNALLVEVGINTAMG